MTGQDAFRAALLDATAPIPAGLTDGQGNPAGRRYAVYRNNVAVSLTEAVETGFPAVTRLIGSENMRHVAGRFIRQEQPASPILSQYGAGFPAFLEGLEPLAHLPYLADVARIDLAMRRSYHAADHDPLAADALAGLDETALMATRLRLAPSAELVSSRWPILQIWRYTMGRTAEKPKGGAEDVAILRRNFDPEPHAIGPGAFAFLSALRDDATLGDALSAAGPGFDLSACLTLLFAEGALAAPLE